MRLIRQLSANTWRLLAVGLLTSLAPSQCAAITLGQVDDFNVMGALHNWGGAAPDNIPDPIPAEVGDRALEVVANGLGGSGSRLLIVNTTQWGGNWTAAGVERIEFDLMNPNPSGNLTIRLGIAGPTGPGPGGSGPTYGSVQSFVVPADNAWHQLAFDVSPAGWQNLGGTNIATALATVSQLRILHSTTANFLGDVIAASFLVDNIAALAAPSDVDGDYNENGIVDAADYTIWRDTQGQSGPDLPADGNGDTTVNSADYDHWKERFGNESGNGAETTSGGGFAIPEPAGVLLGLMLLLVAGMWRWFDLRAAANRS